jgi:hypothetical protein
MPVNLHSINTNIVDGENNLVTLDCIYLIEEQELADAIDSIKQRHDPDFCLLPLSAVSGGGSVFQVKKTV